MERSPARSRVESVGAGRRRRGRRGRRREARETRESLGGEELAEGGFLRRTGVEWTSGLTCRGGLLLSIRGSVLGAEGEEGEVRGSKERIRREDGDG
eukprot:1293712-Pleurochrysis_carterae.AAC.1